MFEQWQDKLLPGMGNEVSATRVDVPFQNIYLHTGEMVCDIRTLIAHEVMRQANNYGHSNMVFHDRYRIFKLANFCAEARNCTLSPWGKRAHIEANLESFNRLDLNQNHKTSLNKTYHTEKC